MEPNRQDQIANLSALDTLPKKIGLIGKALDKLNVISDAKSISKRTGQSFAQSLLLTQQLKAAENAVLKQRGDFGSLVESAMARPVYRGMEHDAVQSDVLQNTRKGKKFGGALDRLDEVRAKAGVSIVTKKEEKEDDVPKFQEKAEADPILKPINAIASNTSKILKIITDDKQDKNKDRGLQEKKNGKSILSKLNPLNIVKTLLPKLKNVGSIIKTIWKVGGKLALPAAAAYSAYDLYNTSKTFHADTTDKNGKRKGFFDTKDGIGKSRVGLYGKNAMEGASIGATIGSIIPGVGTAVGAAIGAVGGLAYSVVLDYKKEIGKALTGVKDAIEGEFKKAVGFVTDGMEAISNTYTTIKTGATNILQSLQSKLADGFQFIANIGTSISDGIKSAYSFVAGIGDRISATFTGLQTSLANAFEFIGNIGTKIGGAFDAIQTKLTGAFTFAEGIGKKLVGGVSGAIDTIKKDADGAINYVKNAKNNLVADLKNVQTFVHKSEDAVKNAVTNAIDKVPILKDTIHAINTGVQDTIKKAAEVVQRTEATVKKNLEQTVIMAPSTTNNSHTVKNSNQIIGNYTLRDRSPSINHNLIHGWD